MNEEKALEAVEHLQKAALELIAAARAVLDVAEDVVKDPGPLLALASALAPKPAERARPAEPPVPQSPRVQHIRVS